MTGDQGFGYRPGNLVPGREPDIPTTPGNWSNRVKNPDIFVILRKI
jgi:hypothetical protein